MADDVTRRDAHPWAVFLKARKDAIDWLAEDGEPDDRIAITLSVTPEQVARIRQTPRVKLDG